PDNLIVERYPGDMTETLYSRGDLYTIARDPRRPSPIQDKPDRLHKKFIDILASLHSAEANLLKNATRGILPEGLTAEHVYSDWPELKDGRFDEEEYARQNSSALTSAALRETIIQSNEELAVIKREMANLETQRRKLKARYDNAQQRLDATQKMAGSLLGG